MSPSSASLPETQALVGGIGTSQVLSRGEVRFGPTLGLFLAVSIPAGGVLCPALVLFLVQLAWLV